MQHHSSSNIKKIVYKLNKLESNEFVVLTHLGLGDNVIVNGLCNYISLKLGKKIHLPVLKNFFRQISFLYSENKNINLFQVTNENFEKQVEDYAESLGLQILRVGFEKVGKRPFNSSFYKQLGIPYRHTYKYFHVPEDIENVNILTESIKKYYKTDLKDFILIHNEASDRKEYNLKISNQSNKVFVTKDSDSLNNIFNYTGLIKSASEIHCINSSFLHLVERTDTDAKLFYHHIRKSNMKISKKWNWIYY